MKVAGLHDLPDLLEMATRFADHQAWFEVDEGDTLDHLRTIMEAGRIWRTDAGMLAIVVARNPWNETQVIAQEVLWWSEDGRGMELIKALHDWAPGKVDWISFSTASNDDRMVPIMERLGYRPLERAYVREV